jgi:voltage-gated potassium channel
MVVCTGLALCAYFVVPVGIEDDNLVARALVGTLTLLLLTATVVWQVVVHVEDETRQVDGLLLALVVAVLAFALAFYRLAASDPGQIPGLVTRVDALYFTMSTLLTIGYGDVHAAGQTARVLVLVSMLFNVVVVATAVTTLTGRLRQHAELRAEARRLAREANVDPQAGRTQRKPR